MTMTSMCMKYSWWQFIILLWLFIFIFLVLFLISYSLNKTNNYMMHIWQPTLIRMHIQFSNIRWEYFLFWPMHVSFLVKYQMWLDRELDFHPKRFLKIFFGQRWNSFVITSRGISAIRNIGQKIKMSLFWYIPGI